MLHCTPRDSQARSQKLPLHQPQILFGKLEFPHCTRRKPPVDPPKLPRGSAEHARGLAGIPQWTRWSSPVGPLEFPNGLAETPQWIRKLNRCRPGCVPAGTWVKRSYIWLSYNVKYVFYIVNSAPRSPMSQPGASIPFASTKRIRGKQKITC